MKNAYRNNSIMRHIVALFIVVATLVSLCSLAFASNGRIEVVGKVYEFDKDSHYDFSSSKSCTTSTSADTYGSFSIAGNVSETFSKGGVPAYIVSSGNLSIHYSYTDTLLNAEADSWHLVDDKSKKIDIMTLNSNILKGAIVVQTSTDQKNWITVGSVTNIFAENPINTAALYTTSDIQIINGCFYRVTVAYELTRRTEESKILFISTDKYETKKCAEVYEFYACAPDTAQAAADMAQTYNIGSAVRVSQFSGYSGEEPMKDSDPHYNVTIGQFYVSGYTEKTTTGSPDGEIVFLKNVGDKVTLWFALKENIDAIKGNTAVKVTPDNNGHDQYFQTTPTDFGRGALIIRYTDYNNNSTEPQIYTNYLEANTQVGADTRVSLFEEGDYEVALDYELTEDKLIDSEGHYRIFFKFHVRNGNCMVYPFDLVTGDELTNSSMTENGFRLDLAKSRYLSVMIKRELMADSADGLVEDTRFNGPARDGAEYRDDGIYTITVTNKYTGQLTTKKIYVGTNSVLKAYMITGLSIPEINSLVAQGATIQSDGTILVSTTVTPTEAPIITLTPQSPITESEGTPADRNPGAGQEDPASTRPAIPLLAFVVGGVVLLIVVAAILVSKQKRKAMPAIEAAIEQLDAVVPDGQPTDAEPDASDESPEDEKSDGEAKP